MYFDLFKTLHLNWNLDLEETHIPRPKYNVYIRSRMNNLSKSSFVYSVWSYPIYECASILATPRFSWSKVMYLRMSNGGGPIFTTWLQYPELYQLHNKQSEILSWILSWGLLYFPSPRICRLFDQLKAKGCMKACMQNSLIFHLRPAASILKRLDGNKITTVKEAVKTSRFCEQLNWKHQKN